MRTTVSSEDFDEALILQGIERLARSGLAATRSVGDEATVLRLADGSLFLIGDGRVTRIS